MVWARSGAGQKWSGPKVDGPKVDWAKSRRSKSGHCHEPNATVEAVQRSHWFSNHQGEQVSVRCVILVSTSQLRLCLQKVLGQAHLTLEAQGGLSRHAHTNGHRAKTQETYRRHIPQEKGYGPRIKKFGIT